MATSSERADFSSLLFESLKMLFANIDQSEISLKENAFNTSELPKKKTQKQPNIMYSYTKLYIYTYAKYIEKKNYDQLMTFPVLRISPSTEMIRFLELPLPFVHIHGTVFVCAWLSEKVREGVRERSSSRSNNNVTMTSLNAWVLSISSPRPSRFPQTRSQSDRKIIYFVVLLFLIIFHVLPVFKTGKYRSWNLYSYFIRSNGCMVNQIRKEGGIRWGEGQIFK